MTKEQLYTAIATLLITTLVGVTGTALEALGNAKKWPWLVAFGKKLEAGPNDIPKLLGQRAPDPAILKAEVAAEAVKPSTPET